MKQFDFIKSLDIVSTWHTSEVIAQLFEKMKSNRQSKWILFGAEPQKVLHCTFSFNKIFQ